MRTTLRLPDNLLARAKRRALDRGITLTEFFEEALRKALAPEPSAPDTRAIRLTTVGGRGTLPGIDLDDSASVLDAMEGK